MTYPSLYSTLRSAFTLCATLALISPAQTTPLSSRGSTEQTLAQNGDDGDFPFYRIVALANLGNNVLVASYDGRPDGADSPSPNSILQRRSTDNGVTWGEPTYIAEGQISDGSTQKYGFSDPSYVVDRKTGKVFNFHVFSKNAGFRTSVIGNDDTDLDVQSVEVSVSTDQGLTWSTNPDGGRDLPPVASDKKGAPPLITTAVKPEGSTVDGVENVGGVVGVFASSGEGIQLRYGPHAGRLVQQFAGTVIQPDGKTKIQAYSVYSDDGGETWQMGKPVGSSLDENKVVELSNGDLMLNSRPSDRSGYRKVAISTDGGVTYSEPEKEEQLEDPTNNAAITRMYPDAPEGSDDAKVLLFSNSATKSGRTTGKVKHSCDDGKTWSDGRVFQSGDMAYSTITAIGNDKFGLFYEGPDGKLIFATLDKEYLKVSC